MGSEGKLDIAGGEGQTLTCLVGRELCLFITVDASRVPAKQRASLVDLEVRRAAPFGDVEHGAAWMGSHASVWYWSRVRAHSLLVLGDTPARRVRWFPEALFTGAPADDEIQLLRLTNGLEGRAWKQGRLIASRWWPDMPSAQEWTAFTRGAGLPGSQHALPAATDAPIRDRQWMPAGRADARLSLAGVGALLPRVALGVSALFTLAIGIEAGLAGRAFVDAWRAERAAATLDAPLKRILDARETVDRESAQIGALLALRDGRPQNQLLAEAARLDSSNGIARIRQWNQTTPEHLEVTLLLPGAKPATLVSAWEASPLFENVTADVSGRENEIIVKAGVTSATGSP